MPSGCSPERGPHGDSILVGLLAALVAAFWVLRVVLPAHRNVPRLELSNSDLFTEIYPMSYRAAAWWKEGIVPLWNPFQLAGQPFLAAQLYGVVYPFHAFYLFLDTATAIEVVAAFHVFLAAGLSYFCARELGLGRTGAFLGGVAFALSGYTLAQAVSFPSGCAALSWLPLGILGVERLSRGRSRAGLGFLCLAVGLSLLAAYAQFSLYAVYGIVAYALWKWLGLVRRRDPGWKTFPLYVALGGAMGLCLGAVQWLPTLELLPEASRSLENLPAHSRLSFDYEPREFLELALHTDADLPTRPYVGVVPFLLACVGIFSRRGRSSGLFWGLLGVLAALISLGSHTPVYGWYKQVAPTGWLRNEPHRILLLYAFSVSLLAALGLEEIERSPGWAPITKLLGGAFVVFFRAGSCFPTGRRLFGLATLGTCARPPRRPVEGHPVSASLWGSPRRPGFGGAFSWERGGPGTPDPQGRPVSPARIASRMDA
ncbi:MAG: hypothetical protein KatS3mg076_0519 [Candidatus Binatia bacterium]|nr:MAG: hypothetical protein KatS3mg076_0519 [Candidatus Binatia bacterium]